MSNGVCFIPIGIAICYCYMTLRESHKEDIVKPWYELNFMESLAIIYCVLIGSIRANWNFFILIFKIAINAFLVILGWYLLYNLEDVKNILIFIIRQNSLEGQNNHETDYDNISVEDEKDKNESETKSDDPETLDFNVENKVEVAFSQIDKNLEILVPEIDKIIENISVDTKNFIKYVELDGKNDAGEISNSEHQFTSEQLVSELERITDNLVRDTKKIADNVSFVSTMIVDNSQIDSLTNSESENPTSLVIPTILKTTQTADKIGINLEKPVSEITEINEIDDTTENKMDQAARLHSNQVSNTEKNNDKHGEYFSFAQAINQ